MTTNNDKNINKFVLQFLDYLLIEKGLSENTISSYKNDLTEFLQFLQKQKIKNIDEIDKKVILTYYSILEKKEFSKATLQRRYSALNQFFKHLIKNKIIQENPMLSMRRQKKEFKLPKFLTKNEMQKLLEINSAYGDILELRNRLIIEILYSTGMRVSELCSLPVKSVLFNKKEVGKYKFLTIKGKGQKERIVPLRTAIFPLLDNYIKQKVKKQHKYLFASTGKEGHITRRTIENIIKQSAMKAGLNPQKVSPHTIRHSFATHLLQNGLDIREIQELLGHTSIDTTSIYAKIDTSKARDVVLTYHPMAKNKNNISN